MKGKGERRTFGLGGAELKKLLLLILMVSLLAAACGGSEGRPSGSSGESGSHAGHDMGAGQGSAIGEPAQASDADRTVNVVMLDELAYEPGELQVEEGEIITFDVVNEGKTTHEFVLGDEAYHEVHEQQMSDGAAHDDASGNTLSLEPGDSGSLTWRFPAGGEVLYGCHEPGHYEGGMVGTIRVD